MSVTTIAPPIQSIHHLAFRCRDAAETRKFYEEVVGLEFAAAVPTENDPATGHTHKYLHIFFKMQDGNFIAFFDDPASARPEHFQPRNPFDTHFAMSVETEDELLAFKGHFESKGLEVVGPLDHVYCKSIYVYDPNGIPVEITWKAPNHDELLSESAAAGDDLIVRWTAETTDLKREKLG
jgi:catechol-2,3-dioxygenase